MTNTKTPLEGMWNVWRRAAEADETSMELVTSCPTLEDAERLLPGSRSERARYQLQWGRDGEVLNYGHTES